MANVVTRFAPSPTGFMHVGGVRTALYSWLYARKHGGRFILRIEDTDKEREVEGSIPHIIESLTWLGIEWDEGIDKGGPHAPYLQSARLDSYRAYAQKLIDKGLAYPDPYTEEELEALRQRAENEKRPFLFREHRPTEMGEWDGTKPLRFKVPEIKRYAWNDLVRGELSAGEEALDDFILIKSDGYPTYNFAHIIDDIEMGVTHVMRGEEFISSTPKFLSLYEALDVTPPAFATMPVILAPDGKKKLGKRDGAKDILEYRAEGYLPVAMMNFLALLGWNPGTEQEFFSAEELTAAFELDRVQRSGARFDETKLLSVNQHWMRKLSDEEYAVRVAEQSSPEGADAGAPGENSTAKPLEHFAGSSAAKPAQLMKAVPLMKERARTFAEAREMLAGELACLFATPTLDRAQLLAKEPTGDAAATKRHLEQVLEIVGTLADMPTIEDTKAALMAYADTIPKDAGGRGAVLWPTRYALSGEERSPDPFTLISILGKEDSLARIRAAITLLS